MPGDHNTSQPKMGARDRKAFGKNKKILTAKTALKRRLNLHTTLVRQSALRGCESWPVQDTLLGQHTLQLAGARAPGGGLKRLEHAHAPHGAGAPAQKQPRPVVHTRAPHDLGIVGACGQSGASHT